MAFPAVQTRNTSAVTAGTTSHTVSLPSGIASGDLLIVAFGYGVTGNSVSWPGGWTKLGTDIEQTAGETQGLSLGYRKADGTEGASITVTTSVSCKSAHASLRISGAEDPATQAPEDAKASGTATDDPDPPNLTPTGGAKDYLWIGVGTSSNGAASYSASTNYSNLQQVDTVGTASSDCATCTEERALNASSENPGVITRGAANTRDWCAATIAVHPGGGGISGSLAQTLAALTATATAAVDVAGQTSQTLGALTSSAAGAVEVQGTTSATLAPLTSSTSGTVEVQGSLSKTLDDLSLSATGTVGEPPIEGQLNQTLAALTVAGTGALEVQGVAASTLAALTATAAGMVDVVGVTSATLAALTLAGTGAVDVAALLSRTLDPVLLAATGTVAGDGGAEQQFMVVH